MKIPMHYQTSEYDCGPTTLLNALIFLFERKDIGQKVFRKIYTSTLDGYATNGRVCSNYGTSDAAMIQFANWAQDAYGVETAALQGADVQLDSGSEIEKALLHGDAVIAKVHIHEAHYVLFTKADPKKKLVYLFDPYYRERPFAKSDILWTQDHPKEYNVVIPYSYINRRGSTYYAFGKKDERLCIVMGRSKKN